MSTNFEFNAPQFINFSDMDDPKADKFFDIASQEQEIKSQKLSSSIKVKEMPLNKDLGVENKDPDLLIKPKDCANDEKIVPVLRKVLHDIVNHQTQNDTGISSTSETPSKDIGKDIIKGFEKLQLSETKPRKSRVPLKVTEIFSDWRNLGSGRKSHPMITRLDVLNGKSLTNELSNPSNSENSEDDTAAVSDCKTSVSKSSSPTNVKPNGVKRIASPLNPARKFISLAEQVEHFYKDTPDRYRSKPKKPNSVSRQPWVAKPNCVPRTPNLTTKFRQRKINFPDEKQREEMELEEMKKHQIKANPLNEKILKGPCLNLKAPIVKRPTTIPQPFSLTEVKKKEPQPEPVFHFKAQPVPVNILNRPVGIPPKRVATPTCPNTPQIRVPLRFRVEAKTPSTDISSSVESVNLPRNTKVEPFSFDSRMKEMLQKKEEYIKKVIEEEKKGFNSFKAHPMPTFKNKGDSSLKHEKSLHKTVPQPFNLTQPKGNKSVSEDQAVNTRVTPFKAKPATVVHQKPFAPKLLKHGPLLPVDFHLNTEKRAVERQKFDEKIKQKEEENTRIVQLQKEEEEKLEREKMLEERKKLEFKAKPMPRYKPFEIQGADLGKLTLPQSPMFTSKKKENKKLNSTKEDKDDC